MLRLQNAALLRHLRPVVNGATGRRLRCLNMASGEGFGAHCFKGAVADQYLQKHGLSSAILDDPTWVSNHSDDVAAAVMDWARDNGASNITHWWQPMGASGVRHGGTGQVHNRLFTFGDDGQPEWELKGSALVQGETDGSSFPNGGLRATHEAGGYLAIDTSSNIFLRGDLVHVPSIFVSYTMATHPRARTFLPR
jgi:glutamine synthetase|eukprot:SAG25_NODE_2231_length_1814_cov_73.423419_2_plen_195_part_00